LAKLGEDDSNLQVHSWLKSTADWHCSIFIR